MKARLTILALLLLIASAASAQVPNYLNDVRACETRYPNEFLCAHQDHRACKADFVIKCARDIVREHSDKCLGLNWKRGVLGDLSLDIFGYCVGPSDDIVNGRKMAVIDIIACAGGNPPKCGPSVIWQVYNQQESPIGGWVDSFSVHPSDGDDQPPSPGPTSWETKHTDIFQRFTAKFPRSGDSRAWLRRVAEQFAFSFPTEGWGVKSADQNRPQSDNVIARNGTRFVGYQIVPFNPPPPEVPNCCGGQFFIPVTPTNHLGEGPPPPPPPPPPGGDITAVLEAIATFRSQLEQLQTKVDALTANQFALRELAERIDRTTDATQRQVTELASKPTTIDFPEYVGRVRFDRDSRFRPEPRR